MVKSRKPKDLTGRQSLKLQRKITVGLKKGKFKKHQRDEINRIKNAKAAALNNQVKNFSEDYEHERSFKSKEDLHLRMRHGKYQPEHLEDSDDEKTKKRKAKKEKKIKEEDDGDLTQFAAVLSDDEEEVLPLDMLDEDNSGWLEAYDPTAKKRKGKRKNEEADDETSAPELRRFKGSLALDEEELLPIKLKSGELIQRIKKVDGTSALPEIEDSDGEAENDAEDEEDVKPVKKDLTPAELLVRRKELMAEFKETILNSCQAIVAFPQEHVVKFKKLLSIAEGKGVDPLVRESVQVLATASLVRAFVEIAPGYSIRKLSEAEQKQSMKKDTKAVFVYEQSLVLYYLKYLKLLEKNAKPFASVGRTDYNPDSFSYKIAIVSTRALCQLASKLTHFNYATNIINCLVRLATCPAVVEEVSRALAVILKEDITFRMSLYIVKCIAGIVNKKASIVHPALIEVFLSLRIKEVDKTDHIRDKKKLEIKKSQLIKERKSKSAKKFAAQVNQLEHDLKKIEAAETQTTKLKYATETMKHVFATYFRVVKRMPTTKLLSPVLAGLSKFAHLINIDFFDDLVEALEDVVEMKHLRVTDSLNCILTVFIILSGEGQALNIDPYKFYKSMFSLLPSIAFQKNDALKRQEVETALECLEIMFLKRRKQVSVARTAAFAKRLLAITFFLPARLAAACLACVRAMFNAHQRLSTLIEDDSDAVCNGVYRPDVSDPDTCNALSSSAVPELQKLTKYPDRVVARFAENILQGLPTSGEKKFPAEWMSMTPKDWVTSEIIEEERESPFVSAVHKAAAKKKVSLNSTTVCSVVQDWLK